MAAFLYFLPGASVSLPDQKLLEPAGLWPILRGRGQEAFAGEGPSGRRGLFICDAQEPAERRRYVRHAQVWTPEVAAEPRFHVGAWSEALPGPEDLARDIPFGWPVEMGDGRRWTIPVARIFPDGGTQLPSTLIMGPDGISREIRPEFLSLSRLAERLWSGFEAGSAIPYEDLAAGVTQALGVNYRLGAAEINLLRLFEESTLVAAAQALIDTPTVKEAATAMQEEVSRKKAEAGVAPATPGGASTAAGAPASSPATSPPAPTSPG